MTRSKKLPAKLLLIAIALVGAGMTAQPALANCLLAITWENGDSGFISCGSSAGNYEARNTGNGWVTYDATNGTDFICDLYC